MRPFIIDDIYSVLELNNCCTKLYNQLFHFFRCWNTAKFVKRIPQYCTWTRFCFETDQPTQNVAFQPYLIKTYMKNSFTLWLTCYAIRFLLSNMTDLTVQSYMKKRRKTKVYRLSDRNNDAMFRSDKINPNKLIDLYKTFWI